MSTATITSKAQTFADDAIQAGWTLEDSTATGSTEIITISHDGYRARMVMVWENGRYIYAKSSVVVAGHTRTVRNASEGRRFLAGIEAPKTTLPRKPKRRKTLAEPAQRNGDAPADTAGDEPDEDEMDADEIFRRRRESLPFTVASPAETILKAVVGREIVWQSSLSGEILSAQVLPDPDQKQLRIEYTRARKRVLTFAARGEGFRSVYIESIIEVN